MEHTWNSRRSPIISAKGICASSQSFASATGIRILREGGNAADAAVAMAAALNVTEPCSTGIGGDAFALYYDAKTKAVTCLQGNGASGAAFTLDLLNSRGIGDTAEGLAPLDCNSGLCITVPGSAALWEDLIKDHGRLSLSTVLQPAIQLASEGFPIGPVTAEQWSTSTLQGEEAFRVLRPGNRPIEPGQFFRNPDLADTFRRVGSLGAKEGFYRGPIAEAMIAAVHEYGGVLTLEDLERHETARAEPISVVYRGIRVFQTPPPSQGLAVLLALQYIQAFKASHGETVDNQGQELRVEGRPAWEKKYDVDEIHLSLECMRRAYCDALAYVGDPRTDKIPVETLLSEAYAEERVRDIDLKVTTEIAPGDLSGFLAGETVYFSVVDNDGNACSMINSNYKGFGSGIVPKGVGFTLQNRGHNFSLVRGHPNQAAPLKRPYHTIIPGLAVHEDSRDLCAVFGNMGGFMQPMGHVQLLRNLLDYGLHPQLACDAPRWYLMHTGRSQSVNDCRRSVVGFEEDFGRFNKAKQDHEEAGEEVVALPEILRALEAKGHEIVPLHRGLGRTMYGRAQMIWKHPTTGLYWAGSDPRADGCAIPYF